RRSSDLPYSNDALEFKQSQERGPPLATGFTFHSSSLGIINSISRAFTLRTSNRSSANLRLSLPIVSIKAGSLINRSIAPTNASTSRGGTRKPLTPCSTVSRHPGASVVMTGRPMAIASCVLRGTPSRYDDGKTYTLACANHGLTGTWPGHSTTPSSTQARISSLDMPPGFVSSPPRRMNRTSGYRALIVLAASTYSQIPFSRSSLAASKNVTGLVTGGLRGHSCRSTPVPPALTALSWETTPASVNSFKSSGF